MSSKTIPTISLGLDHGTSSVKGMLVSDSLEVIKEFAPLAISTNQIGADGFEQNPLQHLAHAKRLIAESIAFLTQRNLKLKKVGLSVQRSGVCAWESTTGAIFHPLMIWKDIRSKALIDQRQTEELREITRQTSLPILPYYAAGKYSYLQQHFKDPDICIGGLDSFLLHQLCQKRPFITEASMASRTMLFSLLSNKWDEKLCNIFSVDINRLPKVVPSIGQQGLLNDTIHNSKEAITVSSCLGDQQAALFGSSADANSVVLNMGTIASLIVPTQSKLLVEKGFISSIYFSDSSTNHYILEGISHASGAVIDFIETKLGIPKTEIDSCCQENLSSNFSWFWSAGGYATPYWQALEKELCSKEPVNDRAKVKALVENIAGFIAEMILILEEKAVLKKDQKIFCTGGLSTIDYLLDYLTEITGYRFLRINTKNSAALGAATSALNNLVDTTDKTNKIDAPLLDKKSPSSKAILAFSRWKDLRDKALS